MPLKIYTLIKGILSHGDSLWIRGRYAIVQKNGNNIEIGDYILFGTYNDEPILWRVINKDTQNGLLLWSDKIITIKANIRKGWF